MEQDHVYEYGDDNNNVNIFNSSASSSSVIDNSNSHIHPPSSSDEISLFLRQILYRSSSTTTGATTSSSSMAHVAPHPQEIKALRLSKSSGISAVDFVNTSAGGGGGTSLSGNVMVSGANMSSSSVGVSENDYTDEHDCQSEEGIQASADEVTTNQARPRSSSKRSRAAEVHNLSEKRRRSRINEKMKALQNLIPNSNKTDKASMLDEAIEYLKHLQLQVQVLTLRNGISLHPMSLSGILPPIQLPQMRMGLDAANGSLPMNSTGTFVSQETPMHNVFNLSHQHAYSNQLPLPNMSNIVNSVTSFGLDTSIQANFGPFQHGTASEETSRKDMLPHQQLNVSHSVTNPSAVLTFNTQGSDLRRDLVEDVHQMTIERNLILSPHLTGMQTDSGVPSDDMKPERKVF